MTAPRVNLFQRKAAKKNDDRFYYASQWKLMMLKFKRHRVAMIAVFGLALLYLVALFANFVAPYSAVTRFEAYKSAPPMVVHIYDRGTGFHAPFVYGVKLERNKKTLRMESITDYETRIPLSFFASGEPYKLWGMIETDLHLVQLSTGEPLLLAGSDDMGRDLFSRIIFGSRISLTIGLVGVFMSFLLGIVIGSISGYFGGIIDNVIQRIIDFLISIPSLPLWMVLSGSLPRTWSTEQTYLAITILLSGLGWCALARVVRGKILALREEEFVNAARVAGAKERRIVFRHLLPSFASYLIVSISLSIPSMILGETSLSFLGLGLQAPAVSWGVLLQDAQNVTAVAHQPWKLIPVIFVILVVLLFNFLGDGLRDAADPYST